MCTPCRTLLLFLALTLNASASSGALFDIVVIGTWESTNVPPTNPAALGLVNGDKFVMKATYDDTTFFLGTGADAQGVTAYIDPSQNAGTSFDVIVPYATGVFQFDESDHTNIGFAPFAEIEFDGLSVANPGNFRNFEIHVDFNFGPDAYDLDLYKGVIQEVAELYNISQGGNLAATGVGPDHLEVVVNDIVANAGTSYSFDASNLTRTLSGSSTGGNGFPMTFDWSIGGTPLAASPGQNPMLGIAESGLATTTDTGSVDLTATESYTDFAGVDAATLDYTNAPPSVTSAGGQPELDLSITFGATTDDPDLAANIEVGGFETLGSVEFRNGATTFLTGPGNIDQSTLLSIFGGAGVHSVEARVTDLAGATGSLFFDVIVIAGVPVVLTPSAVLSTSEWGGGPTDGRDDNLIDGSGLSGAGAIELQTHDSASTAATMWHAGDIDGGLGGPTGDPPAVAAQQLVFDLGSEADLVGALIWNHNQVGLTARGVDAFEVFVSSDSNPATAVYGSVGSFSLAQGGGGPAEPAQPIAFSGTNVRLVKFEITSAHSGLTNDYVGLSEVRFLSPAPPNIPLAGPMGLLLLSAILIGAGARRLRR
jgi:hypothetical protein